MGSAIKDLLNNVTITQVIENDLVAPTIDADGSSVDMVGYDAVTFLVDLGESNDTLSGSVMIELEVEESTDDSTFTDVADADLSDVVAGSNDGCFGVIDAAAEDAAIFSTTYRGTSRYVRPVINVTGTHTNGTPIGVIAIQHKTNLLPA